MTDTIWKPVSTGDGRSLVYSPRFNSAYLFPNQLISSSLLLFVLGLAQPDRQKSLEDPATTVALVGAYEKEILKLQNSHKIDYKKVAGYLVRLYKFFNKRRFLLSLGRATPSLKLLAALLPGHNNYSVPEIGHVVMEVERIAKISDCYPRALVTALLCLKSSHPCKITIGILAPTTSMHGAQLLV